MSFPCNSWFVVALEWKVENDCTGSKLALMCHGGMISFYKYEGTQPRLPTPHLPSNSKSASHCKFLQGKEMYPVGTV